MILFGACWFLVTRVFEAMGFLIWRKLAIIFETFMNVVFVESGRSIAVKPSHPGKFWSGDYRIIFLLGIMI